MALRVASINTAGRKKKQKISKPKPRRISQPKNDLLAPSPEYSCQVDLSLTADFEGDVSKQSLLKKLKNELVAAIRASVTVTARDFGIKATNILVKPINIECAVNDQSSIEDMSEFTDDDIQESEPEIESPPKSKKKSKR